MTRGREPAAGRRPHAGADRLEDASAPSCSEFLATTPFTLDLDARRSALAAGEKQKLELLKQLYLKPRLLILDEPTSVLTPQEADEVLGHVRAVAQRGECTVLMITHKFREVMAYADEVTVLRRGQGVHGCDGRRRRRRPSSPQAMIGDGDGGAAAAGVAEGHAAARVRDRSPATRRSRCEVADLRRDGRPRHARGARPEPDGARAARSSASPASRATASASWSRRSSASGRASPARVRVDRRSPTPPARREPRPAGCAACPRSRCATPASASSAWPQNMALRDFDQPPLAGRARRWLRFAAVAQPRARVDRRLRRQDARRGRADRAACRAATCSARCWRASSPATSTC